MTSRHGFTLMEVLAVIVIATLVIALGGFSIAATGEHIALERAVASLRQMDARARMHARSSGEPNLIMIDPEARVLSLKSSRSQVLLARWQAQSNIDVTFKLLDVRTATLMAFDARGISPDYAAMLRCGDRDVRLTFRGLTGDVVQEEVGR